jgi:hypothetical protein
MLEDLPESTEPAGEEKLSLADLFVAASRELAQSDARIYRSVDSHVKRTREILRDLDAEISEAEPRKALPGKSSPLHCIPPSFERQTRKSLETLCRRYGVVGYSRMGKSEMIHRLRMQGVDPPPVPLEALSKAELIGLFRKANLDSEHAS